MWHVQLKAAPVPSSGSVVGTRVAVGGFIAQSIQAAGYVLSVLKKSVSMMS
jgi:hypothetical protein